MQGVTESLILAQPGYYPSFEDEEDFEKEEIVLQVPMVQIEESSVVLEALLVGGNVYQYSYAYTLLPSMVL